MLYEIIALSALRPKDGRINGICAGKEVDITIQARIWLGWWWEWESQSIAHIQIWGIIWDRDNQQLIRAIDLGFFVRGRILQGELRRLKWQHEEAAEAPTLAEGSTEVSQDHRNEELLAEARILRQHKSRLETRMQILEDHNKQLESQLQRLRELLLQVRLKLGEGPVRPLQGVEMGSNGVDM